ncbi:MAG: cell division FtsZ family protein [Candidatus Lokiarchaeota archaeon]|nr:cell division FtsZ family protein [Candidatus Lokiarchaeota archaeon]MCK4479994.1 cell division FtsZ family protein [Candidatus Lokiarchaeota archaeon]
MSVDDILDLAKKRSSVRERFHQIAQHNQNPNSNPNCDDDKYLADLLKVLKIKTYVVGVGGAGNNTVSRLEDMGINHAETITINTDAHDLYYSNSKHKILIGKELCNGLGSGNDPHVGAEAAEEDRERLNQTLNGDIIFLTCGLGGGTGTGAAPIIAEEAKKNNAIVVTFCSLPFKSEGKQRSARASLGLKNLAKYSDFLIPIPNDNLLGIVGKIPMITGFKIMDEILIRNIGEVVNLINNCGLVNIDFADVKKTLLENPTGKYPSGLIGIAECLGDESDLIEKAKLALNNPLLKPDPSQVNRCLVSVTGDHTLTLSKVDKVISTISNGIPEDAQLKFGVQNKPDMGSKIKIMVLANGPVSPYVRTAVDSDIDFGNTNIVGF